MPEINDNLATIVAELGGQPPTLGQKTMAASSPVVLPSDQSAIPVTPGVSFNSGVMDATTQRVVLASDGPTVTVLGATTDAAVKTDAAGSLNAHLRGLVALLAGFPAVGQATMAASLPVVLPSNQSAIPTTDSGAAWTTTFGVSNAAVVSADMTTATAVTDAPTSGQKIVLTDLLVFTDTAMSVTITEETSGRVIAKLYLAANGGAQLTLRGKTKLATADKKVKAQASVAGNIAVSAWYFSEA